MTKRLMSLIFVLAAGLVLAAPATEPTPAHSPEDLLETRERLLRAAAEGPAEAIPTLVEALRDDRPAIRLTAIHLLAKIGDAAVEALEEALNHPDSHVRRVAIDALAETNNLAENWPTILMDDHPVIRRYASLSLLDTHPLPEGEDFDLFMKRLLEEFNTASAKKRQTVVEFFVGMDPLTPQAARVVAGATADRDPNIRKVAYKGILANIDADWPEDFSDLLTTELPSLKTDEASKIDKTKRKKKTPVWRPYDQSLWNAIIAISLIRQNNSNFEKAMALAGKINLRPYAVYAQTCVMHRKGEMSEALIAAFADEDIRDWPDLKFGGGRYNATDIRILPLFYRGLAFHDVGDGEAAEADFDKALDVVAGWNKDLRYVITLAKAETRRELLDDEVGAHELLANIVNEEKPKLSRGFFQVALEAARYLRERKRYDEAIQALLTMKPRELRGDWRAMGLLALAETYAEAGETDKALGVCRDVLQDERINAGRQKAAAALKEKLEEE